MFDSLRQRFDQIRTAFETTRESDPRLVLYLALAGGLGLVVPIVVGALLGYLLYGLFAGLAIGPLAALSILGRRSQSAQIDAIEGKPGAAYAVLQSMRGTWRLTPAVSVTRKQDLVHLVIGKPGVILVGEGSKARVESMLQKEKKQLARVAGDVPVHTVNVGTAAGQIALKDLRMHVMKLSNELKKKEVGALDTKLGALSGNQPPVPKGPIPRGGRMR